MEDGICDTIRVSLTEDPEFEIPVCKDLVKRYEERSEKSEVGSLRSEVEQQTFNIKLPYSPFAYSRRKTFSASNIGDHYVPVVIADFMNAETISHKDLQAIGYSYDEQTDKWNISDAAADYIFTANKNVDFNLPGTLKIICNYHTWLQEKDKEKYFPLFKISEYLSATQRSAIMNFISVDANEKKSANELLHAIRKNDNVVICIWSSGINAMTSIRNFIVELMNENVQCPVVICVESNDTSIDEQLIHFSTETGALFLDGMGDGIWLMNDSEKMKNAKVSGRTYLQTKNNHQFINNTSFSILQATRTRISKTEYISCPSCGRTLFDLQETTAKIRAVTNHLKGLKIAIMGCIVNGPGEMADADFGYVGSGPGKITLYKGKEIVKRNVSNEIAVEELINLLKESDVWIEPENVLV